jgi:hypothetical protein
MNNSEFKDQSSLQKQYTTYQRSSRRNIPSQSLQSYLSSRPVQTKFTVMPIVDPTRQVNEPLKQHSTYNIANVFNPGNAKSPWSGYASNVNHESELRNQIYALTDCSAATYVPSSNSSLYNVKWKNSTQVEQPFPDLFKKEDFCSFNPNPDPNLVGYSIFNNSTRQQIKEMNK